MISISTILFSLSHLLCNINYVIHYINYVINYVTHAPQSTVPPFPSLDHKNANVTLTEPITLNCSVNGIPAPTIQWFLYDSVVWRELPLPHDNGRFTVMHNGSLRVRKLEHSDFKSSCVLDMLCLGRNDYGESKHYYSLRLNTIDCNKPSVPSVSTEVDFLSEKVSYLGAATPETKDGSVLEIAFISSFGSLLLVLLVITAAVLLCLLRQCKR